MNNVATHWSQFRPTSALVSPGDVPTRDRRLTRRQLARERAHFARVRLAERSYAVALRAIARHVGQIVRAFPAGSPEGAAEVARMLDDYARILGPWARSTAARMVAEVARRDERAWRELSSRLGIELRRELLLGAPVGDLYRELRDRQVALITSIPAEAASRVRDLTAELVAGGRRYDEAVPMILASGDVAVSRATLIARTETAAAATSLTQARAVHVGSEGYVWRTARDRDVRPSHRRLEGTFHRWDDPPEVEPGHRYHAGRFPNCVVGSTRVGPISNCLGVLRSIYRGSLVVLQVGQTEIRVTPNHPILTPSGWTPAQFLEDAEEVLCVPDDSFDSRMNDVDDRKPIEEVFETFRAYGEPERLLIPDLYGDPVVGQRVEVVRPEEFLPFQDEPGSLHQFERLVIATTNRRVERRSGILRCRPEVEKSSLARFRETSAMFLGSLSSGDDSILFGRGTQESASTEYRRHDASFQPQRRRDRRYPVASPIGGYDNLDRHQILPAPSQFDTSLDEHRSDSFARQTDDLRDLADRLAREEPRLDVVRVRRRRDDRNFAGHVFTMEMGKGWYTLTPTGAISKNCRCWVEPVIPENLD